MPRWRTLTGFLALGLLATLLGSCGAASDADGAITLRDAWLRPVRAEMAATPATPGTSGSPVGSPTGGMGGMSMDGASGMSAIYLTIVNSGNRADRLLGVKSDAAVAIELHQTELTNNVAQMRQVRWIDIPAHGEVQIKPGGYHLMLIGPRRTLQPGDTVGLTLTFERAGDLSATAQVRDY